MLKKTLVRTLEIGMETPERKNVDAKKYTKDVYRIPDPVGLTAKSFGSSLEEK